MRFAENLLGTKDPYNSWDQMRLRRWLNEGEVSAPADGENVNLYGKTAVLVSGKATVSSGRKNLFQHRLDLDSRCPVFRKRQNLPSQLLVKQKMAERAGFEPAVPCGTQHFQCCTIGHSVTSPIRNRTLFNADA